MLRLFSTLRLLFHRSHCFRGCAKASGMRLGFGSMHCRKADGRAERERERAGCSGATNSENLCFSFVPRLRKREGGILA